ncbi:hypothetical protein MLD38_011400 [Melastoma candidum]|uniref:Uncharacterized protein n=1 Tax=Melastoma candidum TaxID=119954 RepID=A0ACB9R2K1_9MYRT|nr:hypothetical protein MLD38_011400 [Melastoma candidum]
MDKKMMMMMMKDLSWPSEENSRKHWRKRRKKKKTKSDKKVDLRPSIDGMVGLIRIAAVLLLRRDNPAVFCPKSSFQYLGAKGEEED